MSEIKLEANLQSVPKAMDFLRENLGAKHEDMGAVVELAVEELMMNVSSYAYAEPEYRKSPNVDLFILGCRWVNMDDQKLFCVWLRDWGAPFDPFCGAQAPDTDQDIETRKIGGLGVHLVKHVSKHYVYSDNDGCNTVELYFKEKD